MRTRTIALLVAAALGVAAAPTDVPGYSHPDTEREIFFAQQDAWFTPTTTRVGNIDHENGEFMGWSATAPTDPVGGATLATLASGFRAIADDGEFDKGQFTASGTMTGYLDSITLDLYYLSPALELCDLSLAVDVEVDGIPALEMDGISGRIDVFTEAAGDGGVARLKITNIFDQLDSYGLDDILGSDETVHEVSVSVQQFPLCNEVVWLYGSAEAPSSIAFNVHPNDPAIAEHTAYDATNPPAPPAT